MMELRDGKQEGLHRKILWVRSGEVISKEKRKPCTSFEPKVRQAETEREGMRVQTTDEKDGEASVKSKTVNFCCGDTEARNPTRSP